MRLKSVMTGMAALIGLLLGVADLQAGSHPTCSTCGPAPHLQQHLQDWHAHMENWKGCATCNPRDPYFCGNTGVNGSNGYCNQRLQHVRRLGVLMNHNVFMGDSWTARYYGGFNFTPPSSINRSGRNLTGAGL